MRTVREKDNYSDIRYTARLQTAVLLIDIEEDEFTGIANLVLSECMEFRVEDLQKLLPSPICESFYWGCDVCQHSTARAVHSSGLFT